jgi:hypothetical protein
MDSWVVLMLATNNVPSSVDELVVLLTWRGRVLITIIVRSTIDSVRHVEHTILHLPSVRVSTFIAIKSSTTMDFYVVSKLLRRASTCEWIYSREPVLSQKH